MMGCSQKFQFQTSFAFASNILSLSSSSFGLLIGGIIHPSVGLFTLFSHLSFSCIFHTHTRIPQIVIWTIIIHNACSMPIPPHQPICYVSGISLQDIHCTQ